MSSKKNRSTSKDVAKSQDRNKSTQSRRSLTQDISSMEDFEEMIMDININKNRSAKALFTRDMFQTDHKGQTIGECAAEIAKKWKALNEAKKKKYEEEAMKEKERYEEHLALVRKHLLEKPHKLSANAYNIFISEKMKEAIENLADLKQARIDAREEWNNMSNKEKDKYEEKKEANKELYEKLKSAKPAAISGYSLWVKDKILAEREKGNTLTIKECAEKWAKVKEEVKDKYNEYAAQERKDREKQRDLYEITFGIKPRRPLGPYNFYLQEMAKLKKFQGSNFFKDCSKTWKKMTEADKEKYERVAKRDRLIYMVKKIEFNNFKRKQNVRTPSAFNLYIKDMTAKIADKDIGDQTQFEYISKKWKKESEATIKKYQKKAESLKTESQNEKEEFMNRAYDPPKRARSGYQFYLSDRIPELKEKNPSKPTSELFKIVAEEWKEMKDEKKDKYNKRAEPAREAYKEKMREFDKFGYYTLDENEIAERTKKKEMRSQAMKNRSPAKSQSTKKKK